MELDTMRKTSLILSLMFALGAMVPLFLVRGQTRKWIYPTPPVVSTRELTISETQEVERLREEVEDLKHQLSGDGQNSLAGIAIRMASVELLLKAESEDRKSEWSMQLKMFFGIIGAIALAIFERVVPMFWPGKRRHGSTNSD